MRCIPFCATWLLVDSMRLRVTTEQHFVRCGDSFWVVGNEDREFFSRYLEVFNEVEVVGRISEAESPPSQAKRVDGQGIGFLELPDFRHLSGLMVNGFRAYSLLRDRVALQDAAWILRVPGPVSTLAWRALRARGHPFGVELVTDPEEAFQSNAFGSRAVGLLRRGLAFIARRQCRTAACTAYVTQRTLQRRYPPGNEATFAYSSIDIGEEVFRRQERSLRLAMSRGEILEEIRLVFVGRLWRPFKGLDVLLDACGILASQGVRFHLKVVGGGTLQDDYMSQARELGIIDSVDFLGEVRDARAVYAVLEEADLFVLPSRREGLPRALIEAMAVGLPCISTPVGGIPEVLEPAHMVRVEGVSELAARIEEFRTSEIQRLQAGKRNARVARKFGRERLAEIRRTFYSELARRTPTSGNRV